MHSVGIGRWNPSDGPEEYASKMLIHSLWCSADGSCRWSQAERRKPEFYKGSGESVVIFKVVYIYRVFSFRSSNICCDRLGLDSTKLYISVVRDRKNLIHIQYNNTLQFPLHFFGHFTFSFIFSMSSFKLFQDASHSSDLVCWWVFVLPSIFEL